MATHTHENRLLLTDLGSLVCGSAVSLVLVRRFAELEASTAGLVLGMIAYLWTTLTASGPFVFLARRRLRPVVGHPRLGDWLWALLGTPYVLATAVEVFRGSDRSKGGIEGWILAGGMVAAAIAAAIALARWVEVDRDEASAMAGGTWTNRIGFVLAIALPVQMALVLLFLASA